MTTVLVTGGAGYIGSHTTLSLLEKDFHVVVVDNLCNSSKESIARVEKLTGKNVDFYAVDLRDSVKLHEVFKQHDISGVIHFAALKAVGESMEYPFAYYQNNLTSTLNLLDVMQQNDCHNIIFSSSATVYGVEAIPPYQEQMKYGTPSSPYGASKMMVERILQDMTLASKTLNSVSLRYFNPIGAHESGEIGEDPKNVPQNLMPFISQVAVGKRDKLSVFGGDFPTNDGTCERDYLHVMDLAEGHVLALEWLLKHESLSDMAVFNLGTGSPCSVLQIIRAFECANDIKVPYVITERRKGDLPAFCADASKAKTHLGWTTKRSLEQMMSDTWRWQKQNPQGFA